MSKHFQIEMNCLDRYIDKMSEFLVMTEDDFKFVYLSEGMERFLKFINDAIEYDDFYGLETLEIKLYRNLWVIDDEDERDFNREIVAESVVYKSKVGVCN